MIFRGTNKSGFTLIELLVVISIISLLSSTVLSSLGGSREQAKISAAKSELSSINASIQMMITDTGDLPGGCKIPDNDENTPNIHLYLDNNQSGLTTKPQVGDVTGNYGGKCEWTNDEVSEWDGPYIRNEGMLMDPWGNPYVIDTHHIIDPTPPDPGNCPESALNDDYLGRGPKIYSQAVWTRSNNQGRVENFNPTSYYSICDDIWQEVGPMDKSYL